MTRGCKDIKLIRRPSVADGAHVGVLLGERLKVLVDLLVHSLHALVHLQIPPALGVGVAAILLLPRSQLLAVAGPLGLGRRVVSGVVGARVDLRRLPIARSLVRISQRSMRVSDDDDRAARKDSRILCVSPILSAMRLSPPQARINRGQKKGSGHASSLLARLSWRPHSREAVTEGHQRCYTRQR